MKFALKAVQAVVAPFAYTAGVVYALGVEYFDRGTEATVQSVYEFHKNQSDERYFG